MKKTFPLLALLLVILTACPRKDKELDVEKPVVTQFIYDGMSTYYLWPEGVVNKKPSLTSEKDAPGYFNSLLSSTDTQKGWSWITDDIEGLMASFAGTPKDFGWSLSYLVYTESPRTYVAVVKYVFPNTPAAEAGIVRGNIISKVDGSAITAGEQGTYLKLSGANNISVAVHDSAMGNPRNISLAPRQIVENPVFTAKVFQGDPKYAGKKIGYLFYTDFTDEFNDKLYEAFNFFKSSGVTDLVLDLRYNHGGSVSAAGYLASMIAPRASVQNASTLTSLTYNSLWNSVFDGRPSGRPKVTFYNSVVNGDPNPLAVNLDLSRVYIIATDDSYSAAELLTFCLKPYMNVRHIGSNTGGKYTGSLTLHAYDDYNGQVQSIYDETDLSVQDRAKLKNWAMQPIVLKYFDRNGGDFENPGYLAPTDPVTSIENIPSQWMAIGDDRDYLLAKAISLITGLPYQASATGDATMKRSVYGFRSAKLFSPKQNLMKESVRFNIPVDKEIRNEIIKKISRPASF